jgi:uncharacterized Zn finger protein
VLYGIGARLDRQPELLFKLRKVDANDLIAKAGQGLPLAKKGPEREKVLAVDGLAELFGLELATGEVSESPASKKSLRPKPKAKARSKARKGRKTHKRVKKQTGH